MPVELGAQILAAVALAIFLVLVAELIRGRR